MKFYFHRIDATIGIEDLAVECELWSSGESNSDPAPPPTPITSVKILRGWYMFFVMSMGEGIQSDPIGDGRASRAWR
jgi:hypothetical protein